MTSSRLIASVVGSGILASVLILVAPSSAHANPVEQAPAATVRFSDLDLDTRSGTQTLYRRIQIAAVEVCQPTAPRGTLLPSGAHQLCLSQAVAGAVRAVASPALTAYFAEHDSHAIREGQVLNTATR